jgi:fumarylacetoacetate (FAA) hydrolase
MRLAHVRELHAPAGAPWRLAAALPDGRWLDLEQARRRLLAEDGELAHNEPLVRRPITTLDAHLAAGRRVATLGIVVEPFVANPERLPAEASDEDADDLALDPEALRFGPPILEPPSVRDFYAFETHVKTVWTRRGGGIPEAWYRLPVFYFSNTSEIRGPGDPVHAPRGCRELDFELEIAALVDTPARDLAADRAEDAIGGFTIFNDWSARDLQRDETTVRLGPAKGKDFATSIGPWLVTPDELAGLRAGKAYDFAVTARIDDGRTDREISHGNLRDIQFSFGEMLARASADVRLRPGDLIGSGTVGTCCLLEVGQERFGRWLEPGDTVTLAVERLGELRTPIVARPGS